MVLDSVGFRVGVMVEVAESYENVLVTFLAILSTIAESFFDLSNLVLSTISMTSEVVFFSTISSTTLLGAACLSTISSTIDSCISFESSLISSIMFSGSKKNIDCYRIIIQSKSIKKCQLVLLCYFISDIQFSHF